MPNPQLELIDDFRTTAHPSPVFCHQEFLEKLASHGNDTIGRRAALLFQRLAVDARRLHYKATQGLNRGWRRSRLGGNHGSHFYAWWAPRNAGPLKDAAGFAEAPEDALFLRDLRHHDDHSPLAAQSLADHYLPVSVVEMRREEYSPAPWTPGQARFASARDRVRLLKGHPGSGKTTALWHAADVAPAECILYITADTYHDAVRFANGRQILLQVLKEGQRVKVLSLDSAEPAESVCTDEHSRRGPGVRGTRSRHGAATS